jgi:hypothetical protein
MKPDHQSEPQARLQAACEAFDQWRHTRKKRDRIPESLWEAAVRLSDSYSTFRISKTLRLDFKELKRRIESSSSRSLPEGFVELSVEPLFSASPLVVEIRSPSGFELRIHTDATLQSQIPHLIGSFVSQSR